MFNKIAEFRRRLQQAREEHHAPAGQVDATMDVLDDMEMWEHEDMARQETHAKRWFWNKRKEERRNG